jgi:hypothetical protein
MVETREQWTESEDGGLNLLEHYLGIDRKAIYFILGLLAVGFVVAMGIYIANNSYRTWKKNMGRAGDMMVIDFETPTGGAKQPTGSQSTPAAASSQYFCPSCGMLGLPLANPVGTPFCPGCGAVMTGPNRLGSNVSPAIGP